MFGPNAFGIQAHTDILVDAQRRREQHARRTPWDADEVEETVSRVDAAWMAAGRLAYAPIRAPALGLRAALRRRERVAPEQAGGQQPIKA